MGLIDYIKSFLEEKPKTENKNLYQSSNDFLRHMLNTNGNISETLDRMRASGELPRVRELVKEALKRIPESDRKQMGKNKAFADMLRRNLSNNVQDTKEVRQLFGLDPDDNISSPSDADPSKVELIQDVFEEGDYNLTQWSKKPSPDLANKFRRLPDIIARFLFYLYAKSEHDNLEFSFAEQLQGFNETARKMALQQKVLAYLKVMFSPFNTWKRTFGSMGSWEETDESLRIITDGLQALFYIEAIIRIKDKVRGSAIITPALVDTAEKQLFTKGSRVYQQIENTIFEVVADTIYGFRREGWVGEFVFKTTGGTFFDRIVEYGMNKAKKTPQGEEIRLTIGEIALIRGHAVDSFQDALDMASEHICPSSWVAKDYSEFMFRNLAPGAWIGNLHHEFSAWENDYRQTRGKDILRELQSFFTEKRMPVTVFPTIQNFPGLKPTITLRKGSKFPLLNRAGYSYPVALDTDFTWVNYTLARRFALLVATLDLSNNEALKEFGDGRNLRELNEELKGKFFAKIAYNMKNRSLRPDHVFGSTDTFKKLKASLTAPIEKFEPEPIDDHPIGKMLLRARSFEEVAILTLENRQEILNLFNEKPKPNMQRQATTTQSHYVLVFYAVSSPDVVNSLSGGEIPPAGQAQYLGATLAEWKRPTKFSDYPQIQWDKYPVLAVGVALPWKPRLRNLYGHLYNPLTSFFGTDLRLTPRGFNRIPTQKRIKRYMSKEGMQFRWSAVDLSSQVPNHQPQQQANTAATNVSEVQKELEEMRTDTQEIAKWVDSVKRDPSLERNPWWTSVHSRGEFKKAFDHFAKLREHIEYLEKNGIVKLNHVLKADLQRAEAMLDVLINKAQVGQHDILISDNSEEILRYLETLTGTINNVATNLQGTRNV